MTRSSTNWTPEEVARSYLSSFETRDPDTIAAHVALDFINEHTAALGTGCVGRDNYRARLPHFLDDMQELRYDIESLVVADDDVAAFYVMTALWQGKSAISIRGAQRLVIEDSLIARRVDYWDSAAFLLQVSDEAAETLAPFGIS